MNTKIIKLLTQKFALQKLSPKMNMKIEKGFFKKKNFVQKKKLADCTKIHTRVEPSWTMVVHTKFRLLKVSHRCPLKILFDMYFNHLKS